MKSRRVLVVLVAAIGLAAACGPPAPGPTTSVPEPGGLPNAPRMLTEPVGADGLGVVSMVQGIGNGTTYHVSNATWDRTLNPGVAADRAVLLESFGQLDPATGRLVRVAASSDSTVLEVCDSSSFDAVCEQIPDSDGFVAPVFSPDGSMIAARGSDPDAGVTTLRLVDSTSFDVVTQIVDGENGSIGSGLKAATWNPSSTAVAFVLGGGIATLQATPGSTLEIVTPSGHGDPSVARQAVMVVGWSTQGRIVSVWAEFDLATWPPLADLFVQSVAPDGQDRRDLGAVDLLGYGVVAPDGSAVLPERREVTSGALTAEATVPVAFADQPGATPQDLALPWIQVVGSELKAGQVSLLGFVDLSV